MSKMSIAEKSAQLQRLAHAQGWRCARCGRSLGAGAQRAHRIPQSVWALKRYGAAVIHDDLNVAAVCGNSCNDAMSFGPAGGMREKELIAVIKKTLSDKRRKV